MTDSSVWQYNEFNQVGKDYSVQAEVDMYDARHADFRDIEKDSNAVLDSLGVAERDSLIDFGAGTGTFAIQASLRGVKVYAVDVSEAMLVNARAKAKESGVSGITFCHGGFLTYDHADQDVDFITTTFAFHHLPDLWKGIALKRMYKMLKPSGKLYIYDAVIGEENSIENISALIERLSGAGGNFLREDAEDHFKVEFSTYDWVMDGLLENAGFTIESKKMEDGVIATYYCVKSD